MHAKMAGLVALKMMIEKKNKESKELIRSASGLASIDLKIL